MKFLVTDNGLYNLGSDKFEYIEWHVTTCEDGHFVQFFLGDTCVGDQIFFGKESDLDRIERACNKFLSSLALYLCTEVAHDNPSMVVLEESVRYYYNDSQ